MPGTISESYTAPHLDDLTPSYDDIVTFGRVLREAADFGAEALLGYFESPHKWEREYRTWLSLGGTLDAAVIGQLRQRFDDGDFSRYSKADREDA